MRYQAGIVLPGYNALKVANAPTIGTATQASSTSVSVTFTAPSCVGGGAISSYTVFANCGARIVSGASSPLTVTGLTTGSSYTFKVIATNAFGPSGASNASNSVTPSVIGQQAYTTPGTYTWVAPAGVTSVSVVAVGGGAGGLNNACKGGGGGGALAYTNNVSVIPGNSYAVVVGIGTGVSSSNAGFSSFNCTTTKADGGKAGSAGTGGAGGTVLNGTGGSGGSGGYFSSGANGGGGGAGGYSGNGGAAPNSESNGADGAGGGGGGAYGRFAYSGGGVGILGQGTNGAGGTVANGYSGKGGSGGTDGNSTNNRGGSYGGGAAATFNGSSIGGDGAVRIIWPGTTRSFPSTNTGNL